MDWLLKSAGADDRLKGRHPSSLEIRASKCLQALGDNSDKVSPEEWVATFQGIVGDIEINVTKTAIGVAITPITLIAFGQD